MNIGRRDFYGHLKMNAKTTAVGISHVRVSFLNISWISECFLCSFVTNLAAALFVEDLGAKIEASLPYSWAQFAVQIISLLEVKTAL